MMQSKLGAVLFEKMHQLGIYHLAQDGGIYAELAAYDSAFNLVENALTKLKEGRNIYKVDPDYLPQYEEMVGLRPCPNGSEESRREMVAQRLGFSHLPCTHRVAIDSLVAAGIKGNVAVFPLAEQIDISLSQLLDPARSMEEIHSYLENLLPAHLGWTLIYGKLTFNLFEKAQVTWNAWDTKNFNWEDFDQHGEDLFT